MQIHGPNGVVADPVTAEKYHPGAAAVVFRSGEAVMRVVIYDEADADEIIAAVLLGKAILRGETSEIVAGHGGRRRGD